MQIPDMDAMRAALAGTMFAGRLHHFSSIASTNSYALQQAAQGAASGSVYFADEQTAGRGRGDHAWHSAPASGIYVSVLVRPRMSAVDSLWLSLAAGLAAFDAVVEVARATPDIRWPNDLMIREGADSKKFGGILTEAQTEGAGAAATLRHAVIGIGINVNHDYFPPEIAPLATSLRLATGRELSRDALLIALLRSLDQELRSLDAMQPRGAGILRRIEAASTWMRDKPVHVTEYDDATGGYDGVTAGLDARGFLLVDTAAGRRTVLSGGVRER